MEAVVNNQSHGVYNFELDGVVVAVLDKDSTGGVICILCDKPEKYIQRFFSPESDAEMVSDCRLMRSLGIKSM